MSWQIKVNGCYSVLPTIQVAAGVVLSSAGKRPDQVLIAKRAADKEQGNLWEFPGGKLERLESPLQALGRELREEVGINIDRSEFLVFKEHQYPNKLVQLWFYIVSAHSGEAAGLENQEIRWVKINQLSQYKVPEANQSVVDYLIAETTQYQTTRMPLSPKRI